MKIEWAEVGSSKRKAMEWYQKHTKFNDKQIRAFLNLIETGNPAIEKLDISPIMDIKRRIDEKIKIIEEVKEQPQTKKFKKKNR